MFKRTKIIYPLLCLILLLFSCKQDHGIAIPSEVRELKLELTKPSKITAMNVAAPVDGQEFGVYVLPTGSTDLTSALENNRKFRYGSGELVPADGGKRLFYPQDGSGVDVILYSPYLQSSDTEFIMDFTDQRDQAKLDFVHSKKVNFDRNKPVGPISLQHMNSKLKFKLLPGKGLTPDELAKVEISLFNFYSKGIINIQNGNLFSMFAPSTIILGQQREAIIMTQIKSAKQFRFKVGDKVLKYNLPGSESINPGRQYEYQVTINLGSVEVKRVSAMDWQVDDREIFAKTKGLEFVHISAGTFTMGLGSDESESNFTTYPAHQVKLTKDFLMSKYEITIAQYLEFLKAVNAEITNDYIKGPNVNERSWLYNDEFFTKEDGKWVVSKGKENLPIRMIGWDGARAYAQWAGGDLPTEAQWEYAARAGSTTEYFFLKGDEKLENHKSKLAEYAWYNENSGGNVKEVGLLKPNPWGLFDMYGNVAEICLDEARVYKKTPTEDPSVILKDSFSARGGSFSYYKEMANSTFRINVSPVSVIPEIGFRIIKYPSK